MLVLMLVMSACSTNETPSNESSIAESDERKLETFIDAFVETGVEIDKEEKPMFQLINATDGVVFYMDNSPVKIYEFISETDMKKSLEQFNFSEWYTNGKFAIEISKEDAIQIFSKIK